ncbi:MAG TPA: phosphoribosylglycinamide formyltransferase [Capsulimonadaceae bacterium]|nr:phosphoribosylglycinamide formyltransferase [Capsulimonadaceae bacterium]
MFHITILLSGKHGRGSNMARLAQACQNGFIPNAAIARVIGTHPSPAIERAQELGLPVSLVSPKAEDYAERLSGLLTEAETDLVCLAGFLRKIPAEVLAKYPARVINTHPALLPAFGGRGMYGIHVHQAVLDYGAKVSGCTVHFADDEYDTGPIILQKAVPVDEDDTVETLATRVLAVEHEIYPLAVKLFAEGRIALEGRRVHILPATPHIRL